MTEEQAAELLDVMETMRTVCYIFVAWLGFTAGEIMRKWGKR